MYRFIAPRIFTSSRDTDGTVTTASSRAAAFLDELAADGIEPVNVTAHGTDARLVVSGGADENTWLLFRTAPLKGAKR